MTSLVNEIASQIVDASRRDVVLAIGALLLIGLLVEHELLRAAGPERWEGQLRALRSLILPMLLMFTVVTAVRLVALA